MCEERVPFEYRGTQDDSNINGRGEKPYAIAKLLGRASNTIRNELKRGTTNIIRGYFEYEGYFPDTGQTVYEKNRLKCRQPMKLKTCKDYIAYVEQEVLEKNVLLHVYMPKLQLRGYLIKMKCAALVPYILIQIDVY